MKAHMERWWYVLEGERFGPISDEALLSLVHKRVLTSDSICWRDGLSGWTAVDQLTELAISQGKPPPLPAGAMAAVPGLSRILATDATAPRRFVARAIDFVSEASMVLLLLAGILGYWRSFEGTPLDSLAPWLFYWGAWQEAMQFALLVCAVLVLDAFVYLLFGQTLGKALMRVVVRERDGQVLTAQSYLLRNGRLGVYSLGCGMFVVAFFTIINQLGRLSRGETPSHDAARGTRVLALPLSSRRIAVICLVSIALTAVTVEIYKGATRRAELAISGCQTFLERVQHGADPQRHEDDIVKQLMVEGWSEQKAHLALSGCAPR